jgi:hypothetical protein
VRAARQLARETNTPENHPHHGTFANGIAHPQSLEGEFHVGTFADGIAHPESSTGEDHLGTFAEGILRDLSS